MKILEVVTEHTAPFKILFEVLKDMLTETNIEFRAGAKKAKKGDKSEDDDEYQEDDEQNEDHGTETEGKKKKEEKNCMKITAIDPTKTVLINLKLDGDSFNTFMCKKTKLLLGVNLGCFYKLIKSMGKNDILSLSMDHESKNFLKSKLIVLMRRRILNLI